MNALEMLKEDHRKVQEMFGQVKATENTRQHKQIYKRLRSELETHTYIEEKVLYPLLKKQEDLKEEALEAVEEHLQVKTLIRAMDRLAEGNERFDAKLQVLMDDVEHHIEEEEREIFPQVRKRFSAEELDKIGMQLEAAKKEFNKQTRAKAAGAR